MELKMGDINKKSKTVSEALDTRLTCRAFKSTKVKKEIIASGLPASPGAASGKVVFTADEAERLNGMMQDTILVRLETSPEDIHGMHLSLIHI